jgi:hypothetical protein
MIVREQPQTISPDGGFEDPATVEPMAITVGIAGPQAPP